MTFIKLNYDHLKEYIFFANINYGFIVTDQIFSFFTLSRTYWLVNVTGRETNRHSLPIDINLRFTNKSGKSVYLLYRV